jgi:hypothetical protein
VLHRLCFVVAICLFAFAITVRTTGGISSDARQAAQTPDTQKNAPLASQPGYVGSDTCEACHTQGESLKGTPHAMVANPRTPAATQGCENCHGPGQAHVDDEAKGHIRKFAQVTPGETNPHVSELSHRRIKSRSGFCTQGDGDEDAVQGKATHV